MPPDQMFAFFVFAAVAAVTPGPSNLMVLAAGARAGFVGGLPCLAGVVAGMALMIGLGQLGLGEFVASFPAALPLLKWIGSAFLLWLAWKVASAPPMSGEASGTPVGFWKAFVFQWANPKSWIVSISAAGAYGGGHALAPPTQAVLMGTTFALAAAPACALWLGCGASLQRWLADARRGRVFNVTMGIALAGSVVLVAR